MKFEAVIGLEVHAQLLTKSKIFCGCSTTFGQLPNSAACPVCLGLPGALPVLNREAVSMAVKMILAVKGRVGSTSIFARKNYFYPDLPKGYQISQFDRPIGIGGSIAFEDNGIRRQIRLTRIHLEEDAGKSLHPDGRGEDFTRVDVNRCGVPLIEIVSEPDIRSPREAYLFLHALKQIVEYLGVCDGNMEEGSLRCDANVSIRPVGESRLGTKTEVKNLNSIRGVEKALTSEIDRQIAIVSSGARVQQQTLLYSDTDGRCYPMRSKEESHDYRYFPDPDLVPLQVTDDWIAAIQREMPELPLQRQDRYVRDLALPRYDAEVLTASPALAAYFEETLAVCPDAKLAANWIMTEVLARIKGNATGIDGFAIDPARFGGLLRKIRAREITGKIGKELFEYMIADPRTVEAIIAEKGLAPISDSSDLDSLIDKIIADHPKEVARYRDGATKLLAFFVGQVMKSTGGRADPALTNELLRNKLAHSE